MDGSGLIYTNVIVCFVMALWGVGVVNGHCSSVFMAFAEMAEETVMMEGWL